MIKFPPPFSDHGFPDSIQTYGLVSGLWTSTFALGAFIGPFISGLLYDYVGFRKGVIFIIVTQLLVGFITAMFLCYGKKTKSQPKLYKELEAQEPLIPNHKHHFDSYGTDSINGNLNGGGVEGVVGGTLVPVVGSPMAMSPQQQIKDRTCFFHESPHQTNPAILSIA